MSTNPLDQLVSGMVGSSVPSPAAQRKQVAAELKNIAMQWPISLVNQLNDVMNRFWSNPDPQKLADEMDTQGGEGFTATLFQYHYELSAFVTSKVPSLADKLVQRPKEYKTSIDPTTKRVVITEVEE